MAKRRNGSSAARQHRTGPAEASIWWLGTCPVCGTGVLVDDEFVRRHGKAFHRECELYAGAVAAAEELRAEMPAAFPRSVR